MGTENSYVDTVFSVLIPYSQGSQTAGMFILVQAVLQVLWSKVSANMSNCAQKQMGTSEFAVVLRTCDLPCKPVNILTTAL